MTGLAIDLHRIMGTNKKILIALGLTIVLLLLGFGILQKRVISIENKIDDLKILNELKEPIQLPQRAVEIEPKEMTARVTGYNSVPEQTDSTPCHAGSEYICGRTDVVACPRSIPKGTWVEIDEKMYECLDRLNVRYDQRFDIFCDQDFECPYVVTGTKKVVVYFKT